MPAREVLVRLRKVIKDYQSLRPLRVESLDLHEGQTLALCGFDQMTAEILVDLITAAIVPDTGEVRVWPTDHRDRRSGRVAPHAGSVRLAHRARGARRAVHRRAEPGHPLLAIGREPDRRPSCARVAMLAQEIGFRLPISRNRAASSRVGPAPSSTGSSARHGTPRCCWPNIPTRPLLPTTLEGSARISSGSCRQEGMAAQC